MLARCPDSFLFQKTRCNSLIHEGMLLDSMKAFLLAWHAIFLRRQLVSLLWNQSLDLS
jgi:hypothetical protein